MNKARTIEFGSHRDQDRSTKIWVATMYREVEGKMF